MELNSESTLTNLQVFLGIDNLECMMQEKEEIWKPCKNLNF